jgi:hypothetical protein
MALLAAVLGTQGCTLPAANYSVSLPNTLALREAGLPKIKVGEIRKEPRSRADVDKLRSRGSTLVSPYGSYTAYLREALTNELDHADLLDANSTIRIDGTLLHNDIEGDAEREYAVLTARFTVNRDGTVAYESTKTVRHEWDSSFVGAVALPRSAANYRAGVQRLIAAFIADPDFTKALRAR